MMFPIAGEVQGGGLGEGGEEGVGEGEGGGVGEGTALTRCMRATVPIPVVTTVSVLYLPLLVDLS